MKTQCSTFALSYLFLHLFATVVSAQSNLKLSDTKVIGVILTTKDPAHPVSINRARLSTITIYGTERKVMDFIYAMDSAGDCNCLLVRKDTCLSYLRKNGVVIDNVSSQMTDKASQTVSIEIPPSQPGEYNDLFNSYRSNDNKCTSEQCLTLCSGKGEVCYTVDCNGMQYEICYDGAFSISGSNGSVTVEASLQ